MNEFEVAKKFEPQDYVSRLFRHSREETKERCAAVARSMGAPEVAEAILRLSDED